MIWSWKKISWFSSLIVNSWFYKRKRTRSAQISSVALLSDYRKMSSVVVVVADTDTDDPTPLLHFSSPYGDSAAGDEEIAPSLSSDEPEPDESSRPNSSVGSNQRLASLDVFRGLTVAVRPLLNLTTTALIIAFIVLKSPILYYFIWVSLNLVSTEFIIYCKILVYLTVGVPRISILSRKREYNWLKPVFRQDNVVRLIKSCYNNLFHYILLKFSYSIGATTWSIDNTNS